jgi:arsenite oxidase small subunit
MKCNRLVDVGRRQFLRGGVLGAAGAAAAVALPAEQAQAQALARVEFPVNRLANVGDLKVNEPVDVAYPDADSPGVLLKLGTPVPGGAGADGDIVAYSVLCPHKGWLLSYNGGDKTLNCPGHFSRFDCEAGGQQIWGHATQNLPQFKLRVDDKGDIYADGVDELIYGRLSNVLSA